MVLLSTLSYSHWPSITVDATGPKHFRFTLTRLKLEQLGDRLYEQPGDSDHKLIEGRQGSDTNIEKAPPPDYTRIKYLCAILGVEEPSDAFKMMKWTVHRLICNLHPDKNFGATELLRSMGAERLKEVLAAWKELKELIT